MQSILLGTGGGECIPALFCDCEVCRRARRLGGREIRTRTDFMIDEQSMIDFGPDVYSQCVSSGVDLLRLKNIFLTHFHDDHISLENLIMRHSGKVKGEFPVRIWGSPQALDAIVKEGLPFYRIHGWDGAPNYFSSYEFCPIEPYRTYEIDGMSVTPVPAAHGGYAQSELGYNYIVKNKAGKTFLYAADTGWYEKETWQFFKEWGGSFDFLVMECTYGDHEIDDYAEGHLDFKNLRYVLQRLEEYGCMKRKTPVYLTHICHLNRTFGEDIHRRFADEGWNVTAGYDGMRVAESE